MLPTPLRGERPGRMAAQVRDDRARCPRARSRPGSPLRGSPSRLSATVRAAAAATAPSTAARRAAGSRHPRSGGPARRRPPSVRRSASLWSMRSSAQRWWTGQNGRRTDAMRRTRRRGRASTVQPAAHPSALVRTLCMRVRRPQPPHWFRRAAQTRATATDSRPAASPRLASNRVGSRHRRAGRSDHPPLGRSRRGTRRATPAWPT